MLSSPRGWHSGISSPVRLAAMIPASRATSRTSPLAIRRSMTRASVAGCKPDAAAGPRGPERHLLVRDVDHPARSALVEVRQLGHGRTSDFVQFILKTYSTNRRRGG